MNCYPQPEPADRRPGRFRAGLTWLAAWTITAAALAWLWLCSTKETP